MAGPVELDMSYRLKMQPSHYGVCEALHVLIGLRAQPATDYWLLPRGGERFVDELDEDGRVLPGAQQVEGRLRGLNLWHLMRDARRVLIQAAASREIVPIGKLVGALGMARHEPIDPLIFLGAVKLTLDDQLVDSGKAPLYVDLKFERSEVERLRAASWHNLDKEKEKKRPAARTDVELAVEAMFADDPNARRTREQQYAWVKAWLNPNGENRAVSDRSFKAARARVLKSQRLAVRKAYGTSGPKSES